MNAITNTRTFKSGNSEAIRLPKGVGFGIGTEVRVEREAGRILLTPVVDAVQEKARLAAFITRLRALPDPGEVEVRDTADIPERPGL